ncbi:MULTISPECIES: hypothetical protein [Stutzerimonas]|jgi:hypothetical protein|uniref:Uncharacterized protein n=1 Tax=Stutzerimonas balearica DSM 6083 TaxID=1123016 RepID=A0A8D3Y4I0_9GAMM|nr:hypothetical protein [Stutzerimonas balearica]KIL02973.1 hypothetical protein QX25_19535 [Stutzerimonas stutzeri]MBB60139.1 hypothetical protein [Pseudomonas sp.]WIX02287.1 hypothetical protein QK899_17520 [Pseudomonas sp. AR5]AJE16741.1 hypothetical protein CL52_17475 [Stutzerimonas balearica DSM 6083]MBC7200193.1 hypothetical protein [Stutzerimonas balearica]
MIRISGKIGDWPVDLAIELDNEDWANLAAGFVAAQPAAAEQGGARRPREDALWQTAQERLRQAGILEGPQLFEELRVLAGSEQAAKRLLVRLRHSEQVQVEHGADAPTYRWIG